MKKLVMDLDGTLTIDVPGPYEHKLPNLEVVAQLRAYQQRGFQICIFTARNMRTYDGEIGKINVHTLPVILDWLDRHNVPYDEVLVGKPWCGTSGFYVDDKAIRPSEFIRCTPEQIDALLAAESEEVKVQESEEVKVQESEEVKVQESDEVTVKELKGSETTEQGS